MGEDLGWVVGVVRHEGDDGDDHAAVVWGGIDPRDVEHAQYVVIDFPTEGVFDGVTDLRAELKRFAAGSMRSARVTTSTTSSAS